MATITKKHLVERIAQAKQLKRGDVKQLLQVFLDLIVDELGRGNRIEFREFGVFEVKERAARVAQNPKTMERVQVPAKRAVKFKAGRDLRERLDTAGRDAGARARQAGQGLAVEVKVRRPGAVA
jgi:integration host factor subunit beta